MLTNKPVICWCGKELVWDESSRYLQCPSFGMVEDVAPFPILGSPYDYEHDCHDMEAD